MSDIRVIIDGKVADLPPLGLNLPITYSLKSREGININTGSRSEYAFELPSTKQNDTIFESFYLPSTQTIDKQLFLEAYIEVDGLPFFLGKCQLQSVTLRGEAYGLGGKSYKVAFYGSNSDWVVQLKDKYLYQYYYGVHVFGRSNNLANSFNEYPTSTFKYILIKWKDWEVYGQVDFLTESTPALFIRSILERIFNSIGYTIDSNFLTTDFFSRLIMPIPIVSDTFGEDYSEDYLHIEATEYLPAWVNPTGINPYLFIFICQTQTVFPLIGSNPYNTVNGKYTAPEDGFYLCEFTIEFTNITGLMAFEFAFAINGSVASSPTWGDLLQNFTANTTFHGEYVFYLPAGSTVEILAGIAITGSVDINALFKVTGEASITEGTTIDFRYLINKSWKSIDFIKGLAHAFNLVFETNVDSKTVKIEPADSFVYEQRFPSTRFIQSGFYAGDREDKTQYLDLSKGGELTSRTNEGTSFRLKWKDDNADPTIEALNGEVDIKLYEGVFAFVPNRYRAAETVSTNPFFAPTLVIADQEVTSNYFLKTPMIPLIWKENYLETTSSNEANKNVLPRLLVSQSPSQNANGSVKYWDGSTVLETPCTHAYMVDYNDTTGYQIGLSFSNESVNGYLITGLLQRFYLSEMIRVQSGKLIEVHIFWDVAMLQNLTFQRKILVNGDEYLLQEINSFNVSKNGSTKTYLYYNESGTGSENTQIQNSNVLGKIIQS